MAKLSTTEILSVLESEFEKFQDRVTGHEVGRVVALGDGVAQVWGLDKVESGEMVTFSEGTKGLALNLETDLTGVVILGEGRAIKEGDLVHRDKSLMSTPVGKGLLGRVVNALGAPIDGKGPLKDVSTGFVETKAPGIIERESVKKPLQTGVKVIDSLIPIGLGQRELIIGDRQTGKTTLAVDTILNQKTRYNPKKPEESVFCIYVGIGQKNSTVAQIVKTLEENGAMPYTAVVTAGASSPAALQFMAPYVGCAMGEYFRDNGMNALIIYDDLSKHAVAYRQISLLLKRPPGREAFPGDVFYLHSRLLERAAKLNSDAGGGSLTALPIIETQAGDVSAYIPTNVISITDGQIFLESELFHQGVKPAINVGISVSRVGSSAQTKAMRQVSGSLKLDLAQYYEIAEFSKFAADLDPASKQLLHRGRRLIEVLKQPPYAPVPLENQIVVLFAATRGYLDKIDEAVVRRFEREFLVYLQEEHADILKSIKKEQKISPSLEESLAGALETFLKVFV
jgi:F-type H+-transporting ATPase subunit alpha